MSILSMQSEFLLPEKEIIINKNITIRQNHALIASITEQAGIIKMWIFCQIPSSPLADICEKDFSECLTNRDDICRRIFPRYAGFGSISEITIQDINLQITQSSSSVVSYNMPMYAKLQHFLEVGVDFSSIEDVSFDELILLELQLADETVFPEIDTMSSIPISLKIGEQLSEVLLEPSHSFSLEIGGHDITRSFVDQSNGNEVKYHISEIVCYDIWAETMKQFRDEELLKNLKEHGHDDVSIEKMKADMPKSLNQICPKGQVVLMITYECDEDIQLNFYTTDFLNAKPKHSDSAGSIGFFHKASEKGKYGNQIKLCFLKNVPIGFDNAVEVELVSWYRKISSETINAWT